MQTSDLQVRNVTGRYPDRRAILRSDNIEARVLKSAGVYCVRLADAQHPEVWLEIIVEVEPAADKLQADGALVQATEL